ncbi:MAG: PCRF domain-containing protein, partial [Erysipelotrichaceae bacterium]|nr:PCRF domain-containing protein [Erysipelotrichaceae bacterium]
MDKKISELEEEQSLESFWSDQKKAQNTIREYNKLKDLRGKYDLNEKQITSLLSELDELSRSYDAELFELVNEEYQDVSKDFEEYEIKVLLSNDYDHSNAILEIHPGAGGTESQDWASMLFRMYQRYA